MPVLITGVAAAAVALAGPPPDRVAVHRTVQFVVSDEPRRACTIVRQELPRVGRLLLTGNVVTADAAVLGVLGVTPGQVMPGEADLLRAEIRLLMAFPARFDIAAGRRPTVVVRSPPGSYLGDLVIDFPERAK